MFLFLLICFCVFGLVLSLDSDFNLSLVKKPQTPLLQICAYKLHKTFTNTDIKSVVRNRMAFDAMSFHEFTKLVIKYTATKLMTEANALP